MNDTELNFGFTKVTWCQDHHTIILFLVGLIVLFIFIGIPSNGFVVWKLIEKIKNKKWKAGDIFPMNMVGYGIHALIIEDVHSHVLHECNFRV
jgi:hypothetical protein